MRGKAQRPQRPAGVAGSCGRRCGLAAGAARTGRGEPPVGRRGEKQAVFASAVGEAAVWVRDPFHSHDPNMGMHLVFVFRLLEIA